MNKLAELNEDQNRVVEAIHVSDLKKNKKYPIKSWKIAKTTYGEKPVITVEHEGEEVKLYLNPRYCTAFTEEEVKKINDKELSVFITYSKNSGKQQLYKVTTE